MNTKLSPDSETSAQGTSTPPQQIAAKMSMWQDPTMRGSTEQIELHAVYAEQGVNKQWATMTPSGSLSLSIDNPNAQGFFKKGKEYMIFIREAAPGE